MSRIYLASASPRRLDLLSQVGFDVWVAPVDVDERPREGEAPLTYVERVALDKAHAARAKGEQAGVVGLAADTIVAIDGDTLFGKPADPEDAARMLRALAGRTHTVSTTFVLFGGPLGERFVRQTVATDVTFAALSDSDIASYVRTPEPHDKAGSYAIQGLGSAFVERIDGSYSNVVGLPVSHVVGAMREQGLLTGMPWVAAGAPFAVQGALGEGCGE